MGRCLSPCLGDLDPNLYRRRLDEVLRLFSGAGAGSPGAGPGQPLLDHIGAEMRRASAEQRYERAQALQRRAGRLRAILGRLDGVLESTHARPLMVLARHPVRPALEGFWLAGGRLVDSGEIAPGEDLAARCEAAVRRGGRAGDLGAHVPPAQIAPIRILQTWLQSHPQTPRVWLDPIPDVRALSELESQARAAPAPEPVRSAERELDDVGGDALVADDHG
jgi:DNA polymerase-3 subunit epsilon